MRLAFATTSRSDFGLIRPVLRHSFQRDPENTQLVCLGRATLLDDDYLRDGIGEFPVIRIAPSNNSEHLVDSHETVINFSEIAAGTSRWLHAAAQPHWLVAPGDRFELFAAVTAAYYDNVPVAHLFAGDRSEGGHQDDSVRHAIAKLAHQHFTVSEDSYRRVLALGEEPWRVHNVGSPVVESVREVVDGSSFALTDLIEPREYNVICTYHPITTEPGDADRQFAAILEAFDRLATRLDVAVIFTHPNNENGSAAIRDLLATQQGKPGRFVFRDLGWQRYLQTLSRCDLMVGNSSSAMLEAPIVGVPALDVGTRQRGRFAPPSVVRIEPYDPEILALEMERILSNRNAFAQSPHPYGDGTASRRLYDALLDATTTRSKREILQKKITY